MRHALIFAAGHGERMRPLTDHTPKPLLCVGGKPLIVWHLEKLAAAGVTDVVINTSHLAGQFAPALGDGSRWNLRIRYAYEGTTPLETGGGMLHALPLLGDRPFIVVNGDVWCDVDFATLPATPVALAHLLLVDNPANHLRGDFALDARGILHAAGEAKLTYSGIGVFRRELLQDWQTPIGDAPGAREQPARFKLASVLYAAVERGRISGSRHHGAWADIGTPQRLAQLQAALRTD